MSLKKSYVKLISVFLILNSVVIVQCDMSKSNVFLLINRSVYSANDRRLSYTWQLESHGLHFAVASVIFTTLNASIPLL